LSSFQSSITIAVRSDTISCCNEGCILNGKPVGITEAKNRVTKSFYNVTVPPDSVKGLFDFGPPGTSRGITDAYTLFLPPLPVGKHVIEFSVTDHLAGPTPELIKRDGVYSICEMINTPALINGPFSK
jgi:hypothetical protein